MANKTNYELAVEIGGKIKNTLDKSVGEVNKKLNSIGSVAKKMAAAATAALATIGIANFASDCVSAAMTFESSMADVAKVVDGLKDENGNLTQSYYDMADSIMEMSKTIPMTTSELAQIMAAAGTAGIATDELQRFTETAAKMGIAFDSTAEQAGEWMAIWRTALGLTQDEVEVLGDQINYLGNTSSESAAKLSQIVTEIGSMAKIAGVSGAELAALGAATTGINADVAATGLKNMFVTMTAGTSATTKQQEVLEKLGFTATEVAQRMQEDSQTMILELLGAIQKLPEAERAAAISNYFGKESLSTISVLAGNLDNLREQFDKVGDSTLYAGSMQAEYASRAATTENSVQLLKNTFEALKIEIGNMLIPILNSGLKILNSGMGLIGKFVDKAKGGFEEAAGRVEKFANCISQAIDGVTAGEGVINSFDSALKENFGISVPEQFKNAVTKVRQEITFLKETGITAFQNLKNTIAENRPTLENVAAVAVDLKNKLVGAWEMAKPAINYIATVALPAVVNAMLKVINGAATLYNKLNEWGLLIPIIASIGSGIAAIKMVKFAKDVMTSVKATKALVTVFLAQKKAMLANIALKVKDKAETLYLYALYAKDAIVRAASTAATWAQTAAMTAWNVVCKVGTVVTSALGAAFTFLTSPIGLVILAITAVIAIAVLLWKNWDVVKEKAAQLKDWLVNVFSNIKDKCSEYIQAFADKFPAAFAFISTVFEGFRTTVSNIFSGIKQVAQGIIQFFTGVFTGDWSKALDGLKNIFSGAFQALSSLAMAPLNALKSVVVGAFNAIDVATGGKLTQIKNKFSEAFSTIKDVAGDVMQAAKDTISEKLSNIKDAYEEHGGGIKGIAAAAIEGVKGYYTAGFTFIDNLTGGKLTEIKDKMAEKWSQIAEKAGEAWETIKNVVQTGILFIREIISAAFQIITLPFQFIWQNCKDIVLSAWDFIKNTVQNAIQSVKDTISSFLSPIVNTVSSAWSAVSSATNTAWTAATGYISNKLSVAKQAVSSGVNTIKSTASSAWSAVSSATNTAWETVRSTVSNKINNAKTSVSSAITGIRSSISSGLTSAKNTVTNIFSSIVSAITGKMNAAKNAVSNAINALKSKFNFSWSLPKLKLPHLSITGGFSISPPSVPKFSISWYREGGILNRPTIFGASGNNLLGGGEAGKEAVLPLTELWSNMKSVVAGVVKSNQTDQEMSAFERMKQLVGIQANGDTPPESVTKQLYNTINTENTVNRTREDNSSNESSKYVYSPSVVIQGNASKEDVQAALDMSQQEFNRMMAEWQKQRGRTSFA